MLKILLQSERFERFLNVLTVYLKKTAQKPRKIWTVFSGLSKTTAQKSRKIWTVLSGLSKKTAQILRGFWAFFFR